MSRFQAHADELGTRIVPSDGRFHPNLAADYVVDHVGPSRVIPMGELARVFYGGNSPHNKKRIRQRMYRIRGCSWPADICW